MVAAVYRMYVLQDVGLYKDVKRVSDTDIGAPSQCFVSRSAGVGYGNQPKGRWVGEN